MNKATKMRTILITIYVLIVLGFSASVKAAQTIYPIQYGGQVKTSTYVGEVAMTVDNQFFLIIDDNTYFQLESQADLSDYNGKFVQVVGYELKHKVGPVYTLQALDPLLNDVVVENKIVAPVLIVFDISESLQ
ncbi:MAG: hypothetical protein BroJett040_10030 [Oligoflexia bacterium]|nr:MAG: hypothetical protein BroJett040_10030 [Oligoflexia bacterium]